ncbi:YDG domain-containing protein [Gemmiger sp.]
MKKRVLSLFLAITLCLSLTPTGALAAEGQPPEQTVSVTQEAETDAGENASPANPEENPTENAPAAAEKNTADGETGKEAAAATGKDEPKADGSPSDDDAAKVQNQLVMAAAAGPGEPTMMGQNEPLAPADEGQTPANAQNSEAGGTPISEGDTQTEIWCTMKPSSIQRGYDGTTDGSTIPINLTFTDGTNEIKLKEGTGFTAKKTFDSADAGNHTVTVEIELIGDAAAKYKLKAGQETFTIGGYIDKAHPDLTVSLSKAACTVGEKILPLLSVDGAPDGAAVTYYYTPIKTGYLEFEGSEAVPAIDENTAISVPGTYYVYAKTGETTNYEVGRSTTAELTVNEAVVEAASVTKADGTVSGTYTTLPAALDAAQDGDTVKLLADHTTNWSDVEGGEYATLAVVTKTLTLDLNGMTVDYLTVGDVVPDEEGGILESYDGNLTVVDNAQGGSHGKIENLEFVQGSLAIQGGQIGDSNGGCLTCNEKSGSVTISGGTVLGLTVGEGAVVTVTGGTGHAGTWFNDGTLNITGGTFGNVWFLNNGGTIAISGGTFGTITNTNASSSIPLMSLLADNYAFYQGDNAQNGTEVTLTDVTVRPHTHSLENGKCDCGASYVASVTSDAQSTNYTSLDDALNAAQDGDTVTLLSDVDLGETYVTINKSITFDLGGKTLSSSEAWLHYGVLLVKDATVTVKNGTVKAAGDGSCAIQAYRSGAIMTLEDVTATVTSGKSSVTVGDFGSAVIKSGDYQGLYVGKNSHVTLEGGTFRPYMDNITNKNVKSIFWKVNETTDDTSRDCMELLGDGCVYVDENGTQVRTGGGFNAVVTVQQGTAIDAPVAKIGDVEYASLSKAINAVQNGGTITLLDDLDLGNGAVLQVDFSQKNFTIDLDNHTLSADGACLIMLHNGSQLTLKNGTLDGSRCTSYEGVLYISSNSSPKLTLENVTAKSGTVTDTWNGQRSVLLVYVTNGTVVFDDGTYTGGVLLETDGNAVLKSGTFRKGTNDYSIKTKDSGKHLSDYLDESLFWNGNTVLDLSSETQTADEVTVRPCEHNWENGKCTVCLKVCDHGSADGKSMTEDPCHTCGMKAAAQVDITGSATKYFPSFTDALAYANQNSGCTLKLLADVTETTVMISNPFLFDLNGHNVDALSVDAKATIKDSGTEKGKIGKVTVSNNKVTDLTLGGLLEEGYAFKYETGYWADDSHKETISGLRVTVEKAPIQSVKIYAKDKNHKEVPTTMAYGTTGEVTLVSSCRMGETSGADLSYLWYKLEGLAATAPLEGATGANYTLPDNLAAGTHTYLLICTSDGYSKSAEITITVTPISLEGAEVTVSNLTYNGNPQKPTVTVKLGDETLSRDNDYTVQVTKQTDAGSYKLTISGNGNYSGKIEDVEWKIEPLPISLLSVSSISKTYDGSADVTLTADKLTFFSKTAKATNIKLPDTALSFSNAQFTKQQADGSYLPSPEVGNGKALSFTMTLTSNNYVFEGKSKGTTEVSDVFVTDDVNRFTITKAAAPTNIQSGTLNIINGTYQTYTYDFSKLLPKPSKGEYGTVSYGNQPAISLVSQSGYYYDETIVEFKKGMLTLAQFYAKDGTMTGQIGTVKVKVTTTNYEDFQLTLVLNAINKIKPTPDGEITASTITYGDTLSKSEISGKMKDPNTGAPVDGTFTWTDGTVKPDANDRYEAEWTFTPDAPEYATVIGKTTVKVNKATPAFTAPTAQENLTYTGQEQALITAGMTDYGTMQYSLTENGTYSQNIPTGTDAGTYTVWYRVIGDANHNDTKPASVAVRIGQKPLTITGVTAASKPYDGTTNADISSVTFDNVTLNRGTDYTVTASFDDASVGNGKYFTATVSLMDQAAKNYFLEQSSFTTTASITKAAAPTNIQSSTLTITNGLHKTYSFDLSTLLPKLTAPCDYGTITYDKKVDTNLGVGSFITLVNGKTGELTLEANRSGTDEGQFGTITVTISTSNYQDITLTVKVSAVNQIKPVPEDGTITASKITYGQALSDSTITGTMQDPATGVAVNGTFTWDTPDVNPNAGSHDAKWTFTPDESYGGKYTTYTDTAPVTVNPKAVTVSGITAKDKVYDGNTNATLDCSNAKFDGILENDTLTVTATGTFEKADTGKQKVKISGFKLGGASAANYVPSTVHSQTETTATITAKEVTVTITPNGGIYGSVTAAAAVLSGVVDGETVPVTLTYTGNGYNSTSVPTDVDSYTVTASIADRNYILTGETIANFVITPKTVIVSGITAKDKAYDGTTNATLDFSNAKFDGILENDKLTVTAKGVFEKTEAGKRNVAISDLTLGGNSVANYVLAESGNQTETTATITAKEVTVTITPNGGTYGSVTAAAAVLSGVVDGETVPVTLTYTGNGYNSTSVPTDVDSYTVTASIADSNYILTGETTANFVITPKAVIVSGITAKDKAYDGTTNATLDFSNAKFVGILENDKLTVTAKGVFEKTEAGKRNVAISDLTLGGDSVANYVLAESGNQTETTATITAKQITVSITPNGGTYGETITPATVKANDVVGEDTPEITLTYTGTANDGTEYTDTTPPAKAGTYTVTATTTNPNYTLDPDTNTAEFAIAKRPATVTPDNKSKVYEGKDPDLTYAVSGVLDGETLKGITLTRAEGENAGKYAITATADAGANPNYDVTFAEGKFTINPKSIDGAKVVLGKALTANGAEQTQTVEKVLLGDKEIPADSYTVTDNTATAPGKYTLTVTAKGNYTGTVEQTYVIIPAKAEGAPGEEIVISSGKVKVVVKSEGAVPPATLLTDKAELLAMLVDSGDITADELAQIADGASVDIALTVKEANVPDEVKTAMAQAAKGCTIGQYLDISLFKYMTVNGSQQAGVPLHTTRDALTISVAVPDALINTNSAVNRTYCIVRRHDGAITVLDAAFDAASKTLTFKTDRFSDYAIAYKDTAVPGSGSNPGSNNSSNDSEAKKNEVAAPTPAPTPASTSKPSTITAMPQTGDTSNPTLYVVLLVASLLGLAVVFACKKRNDK